MATGRVPTTANSPLTAKGDLFGYSTTQARVAVGSDGETIVADSSTSTGLRYQGNFAAGKNAIINGAFNNWQRGTSFSGLADQAYFADRFSAEWFANGATNVFSRQSFTPGTAPVSGYESPYFARCAVTSGAAGTIIGATQKIENVQTFAGQTVTVSFWAKADSARAMTLYVVQNFGSGGSASVSSTTSIGSNTTAWVRYTITAAIPAISGKTVGTSSYLAIGIIYNAASSALGSAVLDLWGVQVEAGSVATAFQTATGTIQGELAACQRYYQSYGAYELTGDLYASGGGVFFKDLICQMRTTPTVTYPAGPYTNDVDQFLVGSMTPTALASATFTANSFTFYASGGSGLTGGFPCTWTGSTIQLSSEL